jgi:biotin carboxyl carrier protein
VRFVLTQDGQDHEAEVREVPGADGRYRVRLGDAWIEVDARYPARGPVSLLIDGAAFEADVTVEAGDSVVAIHGRVRRLRVETMSRRGARGAGSATGAGQRLVAPMPGRVVAVPARPGQVVEPGTPLVVLEAMKMENEFRSTGSGVVTEVHVTPGQTVTAGEVLVMVGPVPGPAPS